MSKKTLGEELSEAGAEFILIFLVLAVVLSPYIIGGIIGGIIAIILVVGIVILVIAGLIDRRRQTKKSDEERRQNMENWCYGSKDCPHCGHSLSKAATRCPFCKKKV